PSRSGRTRTHPARCPCAIFFALLRPAPSMRALFPLALLLLTGCAPATDPAQTDPVQTDPVQTASPRADSLRPDWGAHFERYGGVGTVVVLDALTRQRHIHNPERAAERFVPASTFKIYNSLVAL